MGPILLVQPLPIPVEAVAVFHGELAHANQAAAGAGFIPPFGLDVVDERGELAIGMDDVPHQVGDHLLVGHGQHHIPARAVLHPPHLRADLIPSARLLPDLRGMHHGHGHLLPANSIHLFPHNVLDLIHHPSGQGEIAEDARTELTDVARAHKQLMADEFCVCGGFPQGFSEQTAESHRRLSSMMR